MLSGWQAIVASQDDGSFQIAVPPGKGHLLVFGPTGDYVLGEIGSNRLYYDRPGGQRYHAHAIIPYEVKAGESPHEVAAALRPGVTIKGRVEGPDGQTITDGFILTTLRIEPFSPFWRGDYLYAPDAFGIGGGPLKSLQPAHRRPHHRMQAFDPERFSTAFCTRTKSPMRTAGKLSP